ncbi:methyl-accepting chemotaxis protein [Aciduricibacillus chroicocephali]|uniref:Methyl-accepting chemotaxis protein n=1 Tax=Aciduricibacillus chroicocephali TaxID=3054939 RepID=A0ABY9KYS4_9BACI|nr:methyl-accepting chemotaxis protein [Bacillaceae bacterium 44XB]
MKSVKQKLLAGFGVVILLIVGIGIYNSVSVSHVNKQTTEIMDRQVPFLVANSRISYDIANRLAVARAYVLYEGNKEYRDRFKIYSEQSKEYEMNIKEKSTKPEFLDKVDDVSAWDQSVLEKVFDVYDKDGKEAALRNLKDEVEPQARELMTFFDVASSDREKAITKAGTAVLKSGKVNITTFIILSLIMLVASVAIALMTARMIANPIKEVMEWMKSLAKGDLSREPLIPSSRDEVGQLIVAANDVNEQMREIMQEIGTVSERVSSQSEELTQSASEVKAGAEQIAVTMEELADGSETQANKASELSGLMSGFSNEIRHASNNGTEVNEASNHVLELAEEGGLMMAESTKQMERIEAIVQNAVDKMDGLDTQSKEISQLVGVIKDISDQTNLLALNASIEAARAGEHGKGFAVVANEVGKLAEQVGNSVTNITHIVTSIQSETSDVSASLESGYKEVGHGTDQIRKTEKTFSEIKNALVQMAERIDAISGNLAKVSSGSDEMNAFVQEIAAVSEESAAGVEQTSATSQQSASSMEEIAESSGELANLAEQLNGLVGKFKL